MVDLSPHFSGLHNLTDPEILFIIIIILTVPGSVQSLSSLTRHQIHLCTLCGEHGVLTTEPPGKSPLWGSYTT